MSGELGVEVGVGSTGSETGSSSESSSESTSESSSTEQSTVTESTSSSTEGSTENVTSGDSFALSESYNSADLIRDAALSALPEVIRKMETPVGGSYYNAVGLAIQVGITFEQKYREVIQALSA